MSLPHAVFLQRVADEPATSPEVRLGQGAFLALRFVDLLAGDREPPAPDVFRYQWAATERYCGELSCEGTEAAHLSGIVNATGEAHRNDQIRLIAPALLAYALYLEQDAHLQEAEDVLETLTRVGGERLASTDAIATWLRLGRVRRMQASFDRANVAYVEGGRLASVRGDGTAVLLSRIGQCNVLYFRGNLADAEHAWRAVLADAEVAGVRRAQAEAEHGLGTVLFRRGQSHEGAPHLWRAFELYEDDASQLRALNDLGLLLLSLGDVSGAEHALMEVVRRERVQDNLANAKIELLHCASFRRDRVSFERWRERVAEHLESAAPNVRADYHLKVGIGFARFGNYRRADDELRQAIEIAVAHGLHEMTFRIERFRGGLHDCKALEHVEGTAAESFTPTEALREVSASLAALSR
ncbi:MAG: hypothetical protein Q8Q14_14840 [Gemmatimonadales bacterium]|nr:hypothetical protein [Gemmatimonadales bacterium]